MKAVLAVACSVLTVVSIRLLVRCWLLEEAVKSSYWQGHREGWHEATRELPGYSKDQSKDWSMWN